MSDGKRYKSDEPTKLDKEEEEIQKQYQKLLEEIERKKEEDKEMELEKQELFQGDVEKEVEGPIKLVNDIDPDETIQKIKEEIKGSTEQILEKIENESGVERESQKLNEIKEKIEKLEKEVLNKNDEVVILSSDKVNEIEKEILFSIDEEEMEQIKLKEETEVKEETKEVKEVDNIKVEKTNKKTKKQSPKALKIIGNILYYIAFLFIVLILLLVAIQRFSNNQIALGGFRMFNILTGSMEPDYKVGDVLISKEIDPADIQLGDDIVYEGKEEPFTDLIVTHRVVDLNEEEDGTYKFITRGLANDVDDPIITESQVYGKIIYKVRSFSLLSKAINNMYVFFFVIFIPVAVLVFIKILQVKYEKTSDYEE